MFKAISFSKGIMAIGLVAALAVGGLGFGGGAEAADDLSDIDTATKCKAIKNLLPKLNEGATAAEQARNEKLVNDLWKKHGCQAAYGDIKAISTGGAGFGRISAGVTPHGSLVSTITSSPRVSGPIGTGTTMR